MNPVLQDVITEALEVARWAPSAHNSQPWALRWDGEQLVVSLHELRQLSDGDPSGRQSTISVGCFLEYLELAASEIGLRVTVRLWNPGFAPGDLASVSFHLEGTQGSMGARALLARSTARGPYEPSVSDELVDCLESLDKSYEAKAEVVTERDRIGRIGYLVEVANRAALALPAMRRELAELVHSDPHGSRGMRIEGMLLTGGDGKSPREAVWRLDPTQESAKIGQWYATSPVLVVVSTDYDGPEAWLQAGKLAARMMVESAALDFYHCTSAAPVEVPTVLPLLRAELRNPGRPQMLFRVGLPRDSGVLPRAGRLAVEELFSGESDGRYKIGVSDPSEGAVG